MKVVLFFIIGIVSFGCRESNVNSVTASNNIPSENNKPVSPSYYKPLLNDHWHYQLTGEINTSIDAKIFDIDLYDTPTEIFTDLHTQNKIVICYFSAGSSEDWRDDFSQFHASDMGSNLDGWPGERWLDVRSENVKTIILARLDYALLRGCDGVEADNVDGYTNDPGFDFSANDQLEYNQFLAKAAHDRNLSIGLKNSMDQASELVEYFDFSVNEQCHQYNECEKLNIFIENDKPVFNVEYNVSYQNETKFANLCNRASVLKVDTLFLPLDLDGSFRSSCQDIQ